MTQVTIMVNHNRPFYSLSSIQALVEQNRFHVANTRANNRLQDLEWDSKMLKSFILALKDRHFYKCYPQQEVSGTFCINCDAYKMRFDEEVRQESRYNGIELFIKLAIAKTSDQTLIISFHTEGSPG